MGIFRKKGNKTIFIEDGKKKVDGRLVISNESGEKVGQMDMHWEGNAKKLHDAKRLQMEAEVEGEVVMRETFDNPQNNQLPDDIRNQLPA